MLLWWSRGCVWLCIRFEDRSPGTVRQEHIMIDRDQSKERSWIELRRGGAATS